MALSESRKAEIIEEEKLRLQARRDAWKELYEAERGHGHYGCGPGYGHRRFWLGRLLFWALVVGGVAMLVSHHACSF